LLIFLFSQIKQRRNSNRLHIRTYFKRNRQKKKFLPNLHFHAIILWNR